MSSLQERFDAKWLLASNGCWEWVGCIGVWGYGQISFMGKSKSAHRISWELYKGEIPKGKLILHKCDNPACVNPSHLFIGTWGDNMKDMVAKDRQANKFRRGSNAKPISSS